MIALAGLTRDGRHNALYLEKAFENSKKLGAMTIL